MKRDKQIRNIVLAIIAGISIIVLYIGLKYYNNTDTNNIKEETNCFTTTIKFDFDCITDIIYNPETNLSYIKYNDIDAFDYDNLAHYVGMDEWYGDYIICDIDPSIALQFNEDNITFNNIFDYYIKTSLNNKYVIIETECDSNITWEIKSYNCLK